MRGLLIALLFVPSALAFYFPWTDVPNTQVKFDIEIICHYYQKYIFNAGIFETDSMWSGDDGIIGRYVSAPRQIKHRFRMEGEVQGDKMQSSEYTFQLDLTHTCGFQEHKRMHAEVDTHPPCPVGSRLCQYKFHVRIDTLEGKSSVTSKILVNPPEPASTTEEPEEEEEYEDEPTVRPVITTKVHARPTLKPVKKPLKPRAKTTLEPPAEAFLNVAGKSA